MHYLIAQTLAFCAIALLVGGAVTFWLYENL
jgi:hypothetical protein